MRCKFLVLLLLASTAYAEVPRPVRDTSYDWRCVNPDGTFTSHQRQDTAIYACQDRALNNPGQTFYIEGGRYRVRSDAAQVDYGPPDREYFATSPSDDSIHPGVPSGTRIRVWDLSGGVEVLSNGSTRVANATSSYSLAWSEETPTGWTEPREIIWN